MKNNESNIFINPELVFNKIEDEQVFFPMYYQSLGGELRNIHALLAMKHCWEFFEQKEEYEKIIPIKKQIDVFFRNEEPDSHYNNMKNIDDILLAPKNISEALYILKEEMIRTNKVNEKNFYVFNDIDVNINVALHFSYFHFPIISDFVLIKDFEKENNLMQEFYQMGIKEPDRMTFELVKKTMSSF